jgi:hypothetical protein
VHVCVHESRGNEKALKVYASIHNWSFGVNADPDDVVPFDAHGRRRG